MHTMDYVSGNLLESPAQALVNTVNTVGVMGKGIALQFKNQFPGNYKAYVKACKEGEVQIGKMFVVREKTLLKGEKIIINFPTKTDWRKPSEYVYIEKGLADLRQFILSEGILSLALPPLGAGNGGLEWGRVRDLINCHLSDLPCQIMVYEPTKQIQEKLRKERIGLTPARAMLLAVLYDLVKEGEFVSEFASEKIGYFLQRFGAADTLKLPYTKGIYGPYSGKVRHILHQLNGSYITGYSDKNKKPFEMLGILMDGEETVDGYLAQESRREERAIVEKTKRFLDGFYDNGSLELLATVDFILQENPSAQDIPTIRQHLDAWSVRKSKLLAQEKPLQIVLAHLRNTQFS